MLKHRLISGVILGGLFLASIFWQGWGGAVLFTLICTVAVVVGSAEFLALADPVNGFGFPKLTKAYGVYWAAAPLLIAAMLGQTDTSAAMDVIGIFMFLAVASALMLRGPRDFADGLNRLFVSLTCTIYLGWTLSFIPRLYFSGGSDSMNGRYLALFLILVTKSADIGAYIVGTLSSRRQGGNHKILPKISPKKSWEGLAGGVIGSIVCAVVFVMIAGDCLLFQKVKVLCIPSAIAFGAAAALIGFVGDVTESALKRAGAAKDSGMIPGLGGVLDIADSLIFVTPPFYAYVIIRVMLGAA